MALLGVVAGALERVLNCLVPFFFLSFFLFLDAHPHQEADPEVVTSCTPSYLKDAFCHM